MRPSSYTIYVPLPETDRHLLVHGYTGAVDQVQAGVVEYLKTCGPIRLLQFPPNGEVTSAEVPSVQPAISEETIERLKQRGYLTEKTQEEEEAYLARLAESLFEKDTRIGAGFLFIPGYGCNLRCPYCFEKDLYKQGTDYDHHIQPGWRGRVMDRETADLAFRAMAEIEPDPRRVWYVEFYGGEPLVHYTREIVEYILKRGLDLGYGAFRAATNGVELDLFFDLIGPGKINHLQITLDGPPEVHDSRRFLPGRTGTFERISNNITKALELGAGVTARVNVDKKNVKDVNRLAAIFAERGWNKYPRFGSCLTNVVLNKESKTQSRRFASEFEMEEHARQGEGEGPILGNDWGISAKLRHVFQTGRMMPLKAHFCGAAVGMYLFDPFGDIYTCWELVGEQHAKVGCFVPSLKWGEGSKAWRRRAVGNIPECRKCRYALFCGGGCPKWAYDANGAFMSPYCNDFEKTFLHYTRLTFEQVAPAARPAAALHETEQSTMSERRILHV